MIQDIIKAMLLTAFILAAIAIGCATAQHMREHRPCYINGEMTPCTVEK